MTNTVYAIKRANTQTWDKQGKRLPITIAHVPNMVITQLKTKSTDGYESVQVGFGTQKKQRVTKPMLGHLSKSKLEAPVRHLKEINLQTVEGKEPLKVGDSFEAIDSVTVGDVVNVSSKTKGTGFTGVMKRWGFSGGPRTHGQSDRERAPGSIGQGTSPGRVWKGKKMAGRDGNLKVTQRNLMIVKIDTDANEIWLKGTTPGHIGSMLSVEKVGHEEFPGLLHESQPDKVEESIESNQEEKS